MGSNTPVAGPTRVLGEQATSATVQGKPAPPGTGELGAVSCADALHCWTVGVAGPNATTAPATVIAATVNGGQTWAAQSTSLPSPPELDGVSCPTATTCMAVGSTGAVPGTGVVLTTRNGGTSWVPATIPTGAFVVTAVQCAAVAHCMALISDGTNIWAALSTDLGRTWTQLGNLPTAFSNPRTLACGADSCLVTGYLPTTTGHGAGAIALSVDDGHTWTLATVPAHIGVLQDATCPTPTSCLAVGTTSTTVSDVVPAQGQLLASADGGHTWVLSPAIPPVDDIYAIACPSAKGCAMVGTVWHGTPPLGEGGVAQSTNGGQSFTASSAAYVPLTLTALACPTSTNCVAVGGDSTARIELPTPAPTTSNSTPRRVLQR
jgi:photosystem II stability/assembly factor-like uncharacterized protein